MPAAVELTNQENNAGRAAEGKRFPGMTGNWLPRRWKGAYPLEYTDTAPTDAYYSLTQPVGVFKDGDIWIAAQNYSADATAYIYDTGIWREQKWNSSTGNILLRTPHDSSTNYLLFVQFSATNIGSASSGGLIVPCMAM